MLMFLLLYLCFIGYSTSEDIFGCGGFVKSDFGINYSMVEIKLYTKHGSLKYQTDCAPNNGYYLIPLYDKGDYILKIEPPSGWNFEPNSVALHIDGNSDPCSRNQDINFTFKGFSLTGKVVSRGESSGPSGIKVLLKKASGELCVETESDSEGTYGFSSILPGNYIIEASHPSWVFEESKQNIEVVQDNVHAESKIIVAGFDVRGFVFSEGEPISSVHFLLFSKQKKSTSKTPIGCMNNLVKGFSQKVEHPYVCHVTSSNDGSFVFPSLPPGDYKLIPFYKGEHIEFDVSPPHMDFTVAQESFVFPVNFQVEGFSVSGRVSAVPKGRGLEGAEIYVNGNKHTKTEANGVYHLENMRAGFYQLEVKMPNVIFDSVNVKVTPNTPHLPEISAIKFSVCGTLQIDQYPNGFEEQEHSILIKQDRSGLVVNIPTHDRGKFCTEVPPGKYTLEPIVSGSKINTGLRFTPSRSNIEVVEHPLLDIIFVQFRAELEGQIKCIHVCIGVQLDLVSLSRDETLIKTMSNGKGKFYFGKRLPGKYKITVRKDDWCFSSNSIEFTVTDKHISDLEVVQTGFQASIILTHSTSFKVRYPSGQIHEIYLQKGKNILCLPESGVYDFIPVSCHLYKKEIFKFDSSSPSDVVLNPIKHLVSGNIFSELNVTDIKILVRKLPDGNVEAINIGSPHEKKEKVFRYSFSLFSEPNSDLEIKAISNQVLVRPIVLQIKVLNDCLENAVAFRGKKGIFINGSVHPPLASVRIQVTDKSTDKFLAEIHTNKQGKYIVGPLDEDGDYVVKADKEGYIFTEQEKLGKFLAFKLAEITVQVSTENGAPLPGVLLSLSGGVDYRKNSMTQKDGKLTFLGLSPGQYFLRPMMKEFSFEPPSKMIDVKEGDIANVNIKSKRVAYSLYGVVNSLTGEAEVGIAVEAVGVGSDVCRQYQEDAISEQGGQFRIRGLQPNCEYKVHLKQGADVNQHIERATPEERIIKVINGDTNDIRLIVFRRLNQMDVSGNVITDQDYLTSLKVRLYREDIPDQAVHTIALGQSSFFHVPALPIDNRSYILRIDSSLSSSSFYIETPQVTFCANTSFYHFTFSFHPHPKSVEQEMTQGSILALPLGIVIIILLCNYSQLTPLVLHIVNLFSSFTTPVRSSLTAEGSLAENLNPRRKSKPRRVQ